MILGRHAFVVHLPHSVSESNVVSQAKGAARDLGGFHGHEQVVHYRSGDSRCAAHSLVFSARLYAYCAHGESAPNHSACAAAIVQYRGSKPYFLTTIWHSVGLKTRV